MPRDSQRQKVYDAEKAIRSFPTALKQEKRQRLSSTAVRRYASQETCQAYVDRVVRSRLWGSLLGKTTRVFWGKPPRRVSVGAGKRHRSAMAYGMGHIELPIWARNEPVILHELAHCLTTVMFKNVAAHGREFCAIYLKLVRRFMGQEWADKLKESYREHKVKWTLPRGTKSRMRR